MKHIVAKNTGEAWIKASQEVMLNGLPVKDGEVNLKESLHVFLTIEDQISKDAITEKYADPTMIDWMRRNFFDFEPVLDWGYSYGQRFFNYDGINQIKNVIKKLKKNPESKSATISLMNPDGDKHHMPCIVAIDFKIRDNKLITTAFFRSQDVGKKIYADILCIGEIGQMIASQLDLHLGELHIHIVSLHVYEPDWDRVNKMIYQNEIR